MGIGITRGKQLVVLVGQKKDLVAMAVKNHLGRLRYSKLAEWFNGS